MTWNKSFKRLDVMVIVGCVVGRSVFGRAVLVFGVCGVEGFPLALLAVCSGWFCGGATANFYLMFC